MRIGFLTRNCQHTESDPRKATLLLGGDAHDGQHIVEREPARPRSRRELAHVHALLNPSPALAAPQAEAALDAGQRVGDAEHARTDDGELASDVLRLGRVRDLLGDEVRARAPRVDVQP